MPKTPAPAPLRILSASIHNFMGIELLEIHPNGEPVELSGENGAGKSSGLLALVAALGGKRNRPERPIREGEERAEVVVDLGELVVAGCRVTIERIVVDVSAARALAGLAGMFGPGGGAVAAAFAPGNVLTVPADLREQLLVCETCAAAGEHSLLSMVELAGERREREGSNAT